MAPPDSSSDYDVPEYLLAVTRALGMSDVRARWKIIRWRRELRLLIAGFAPAPRRFEGQICRGCGAIQAIEAQVCTACGERVTFPLGRFFRTVGLTIPAAVSVSSALGVLMALLYLRMLIARPGQGFTSWDTATLIFFGADCPVAVRAGQWWRLGTGMFPHIGLLHLGFNLMALAQIGPSIEEVFGRGRMLFFFIVTGIIGFMGSEAFGLYSASAGASGALMGLTGVAAGWGQRRGTTHGRAVRDQMLKWAGYTILFGVFINANNWAHGFGFVSGAAIGLAYAPLSIDRSKGKIADQIMGALGALSTVALLGLCFVGVPAPKHIDPALEAASGPAFGYDDEELFGDWAVAIGPSCDLLAKGQEADALSELPSAVATGLSKLGKNSEAESLKILCGARQKQVELCDRFAREGPAAVLPSYWTLDPKAREAVLKAYQRACSTQSTNPASGAQP